MPTITGNVRDVTGAATAAREVWVRAEALRAAGGVVTTTETHRIDLGSDGAISFDCEPGPAVLLVVFAFGAPVSARMIVTESTATVAEAILAADTAASADVDRLDELAAEVAGMVERVRADAVQVGADAAETAQYAQQAAQSAQSASQARSQAQSSATSASSAASRASTSASSASSSAQEAQLAATGAGESAAAAHQSATSFGLSVSAITGAPGSEASASVTGGPAYSVALTIPRGEKGDAAVREVGWDDNGKPYLLEGPGVSSDTGWRNISSGLENTTAGQLLIRRVQSTVFVEFQGVAVTARGYMSVAGVIPNGFSPRQPSTANLWLQGPGMGEFPTAVSIHSSSDGSIRIFSHSATVASRGFGGTSWLTDDDWPTVLPPAVE